jgi:hypothetical protein
MRATIIAGATGSLLVLLAVAAPARAQMLSNVQGAESDLQVKGTQVTFKSVRGALYQLTLGADGSLNGVNVPTGHEPTDIHTHCAK